MNAKLDLRLIHDTAVECVRRAGELVTDSLPGGLEQWSKGNGDVVTSVDLASEELIIGYLSRHFPGHRMYSEERGLIPGDPDWTWVIDPLDGTNNVCIGLPIYAVGLTLFQRDIPVVSVVYEPFRQSIWSAVRGTGVHTHQWDAQDDGRSTGVVAWTQGYGVGNKDPLAQAYRLILERRSLRVLQMWAPLTCWLMLVRGDIDSFVGYSVGKTDLYAGSLLAQEAGLVVRDITGGSFDETLGDPAHEDRFFLAGGPNEVHETLSAFSHVHELAERLSGL